MGGRGIGVAIVAAAACAVGFAGCGDSAVNGTGVGANTLTIYSSLPLQGQWRDEALGSSMARSSPSSRPAA